MLKEFDRKLVLEDGAEYYGFGFGDKGDAVTEIVFNTSMVAAFLDLRLKRAIPSIVLGVFIAAGIMTAVTYGLIHIF